MPRPNVILRAFLLSACLVGAGSRAGAEAPPAQIPPFLEINRITPAQYAGAVSFAMESMRLVYGELTSDQEKKFQAKWMPLFKHCTPEVIAYFNKLNPLLARFLAVREAMTQTMAAFDAAQLAAVFAFSGGDPDPEGAMRALAEAELCRRQLESLCRSMEQVVREIVKLGEPPDAAAEAARRRKRHDAARRPGSGQGEGGCVKLSWREPPAGWTEGARWYLVTPYLPIRSDADRHMFLNPAESRLSFQSSEDPGCCDLRIEIVRGPFPEAADVEEVIRENTGKLSHVPEDRQGILWDYLKRAKGVFGGGGVPTRFQVESWQLFRRPALRTETNFIRERDPKAGVSAGSDHVRVVWYAVNLGPDVPDGWLSLQIEMSLEDGVALVEQYEALKYVDSAALIAFARKRCSERWEAMKAIWEREVWQILDSMEVTLEERMPEDEEGRFSVRRASIPSPEVWAARGCPQILNGAFILFDETGPSGSKSLQAKVPATVRLPRKDPKPGQSPYNDSYVDLSVTSDHTWTEPPRELRWGQTYAVQVDCTSLTFSVNGASVSGRDVLSCSDSGAGTKIETQFPAPDGPEGVFVQAEAFRPVSVKDADVGRGVKAECRFSVPREIALRGGSRSFTYTLESGYLAGFGRQGPREERKLFYLWDWMPVRKGSAGDGGGAAGGGAGAPGERKPGRDAAEAEAEKRAMLEQIDFYANEIRYRNDQLDGLQRQLASAKPEQRKELARQIMWAEDWIQRAQDSITTLRTGVYTRTRTAADAFNLSIMATESRELARKWDTVRGLVQRGPHLIDLAPPEDQPKLRKFFDEQTRPGALASGDSEKFRKVVDALGNRVMGTLEGEQARAELKLIDAEERLQRAENVKAVCETELMILSLGGGGFGYVYTAYQGVTGYVEEGIGEAAKRVLSSYNTATNLASSAMDAYQKGVVDAYETYAKNPLGGPVDEFRAGMWSAGWEVGKQGAMELAGKFLVEPLMKKALGIPDPPRKKTLKELSQEMQYLKRRAEGMDTVALFKERLDDVAKAAKAGASTDAIDKLQAEAEQVYKLIKTDWFAKMHLNDLGRKGNLDLLRRYNAYDHYAMQQVKERFVARQAGSGFVKQEYKLFSNSASAGKAGMDVDLGVIEPPHFVFDADGKKMPNPARQKWLDNLATERIGGNPGLHEFREQSQKNLEAAFKDTFGYDPKKSTGIEAFVNFTTSDHPEAYRDLAWLGKKGMKTADLKNVDPKWAGQAADVSGYKVNNLPEHHPQFGYYATLQEQCRGLTKDYATKLEPMLGRSKNEEARKHLRALNEVMEKFAKNEIGPFEANEILMRLTGGKGICEAAEQFRTMMQSLAGMK